MNVKAYVELRKVSVLDGRESLAADTMRHLHTRQYLGKVVVVCDQPVGTLSSTRKQWLRLSRSLQRQRASTLNADKILKFTHGIAHMQHLRFTSKSPLEQPDADIFFLSPEQTHVMPVHCFTVYICTDLAAPQARQFLGQLPSQALVVDYIQKTDWTALGLEPKKMLDKQVIQAWWQVRQFLQSHDINISALHKSEMHNVEAMDDALDTLLGMSHKFLQVASEFQRALELARPLRIHKTLREKYDSLILLAHRVQALTPGAFSQQFLQVYNEDDTFFLHDQAKEHLVRGGETHAEAFSRHLKAGRKNLAYAVQMLYVGRSLRPANRPAHT